MIIKKALAAVELPPIGGEEGFGPFGNIVNESAEGSVETAGTSFNLIISNVIGIITIIGGIWFIFTFILGAFSFLTAGGDKAKMEEASKKITQGVIGIVVLAGAYALISLIGTILGYNILNPLETILRLSPQG